MSAGWKTLRTQNNLNIDQSEEGLDDITGITIRIQ